KEIFWVKKHFILLLSLLLLNLHLSAQHRVQFLVTDQSIIKPKDSIYITGTFDQWDSTKNKSYLLQRLDSTHFTITLQLTTDSIQYKFHRGSWLTVEKHRNGREFTVNRKLYTKGDTIVKDTIAAWRDDFVTSNLARFLSKFSTDTDRLYVFLLTIELYNYDLE